MNPPASSNSEILVLGAALPDLPDAGLRAFCLARETALSRWLDTEQTGHIRRYALSGPALAARVSRVLARCLLLRGLALAQTKTKACRSGDLRLQADAAGPPPCCRAGP